MNETRWVIRIILILLSLTTYLCEEAAAQLSTDYPTQNSYVMHLRFSYDLPGAAGGPYTPQTGYFRLRPGLGDTYNGGYIIVSGIDDNPPTETTISTGTVFYPVRIDPDTTFAWNVPAALRDKIHIESKVIARPKHDAAGAVPPHVVPYPITLDRFYTSSYNFEFEPSGPVRWLDQDVTLQIEVWLDSSILAAGVDPNARYVFELPRRQVYDSNGQPTAEYISPMRTISPALTQISPYIVPISIIGRPPGDQSWSRLTMTSGAGAGLAISEGESNTRTNESSIGFGPFSMPPMTETIARSRNIGNHQIFNLQSTLGIATNNPYRPGEGDVMVCLRRPAFELYRTIVDMDFRYLPPSVPALTIFPMKDLYNPPWGSTLANLTATENSALRSLNPLLADPHAELTDPRYYIVADLELTGSAINGSQGIQTVTKQQVETAMGSSISTRTDSSFTVPIGSIASAIGSPVPLPDANVRSIETTTSSIEYRTINTLDLSSGVLLEYEIKDSNPTKRILVQIYYDTLFGTFAFRDSGPPAFTKFLASIREERQFDRLVVRYWKAIAQDDKEAKNKKYTVIGSLSEWTTKEGVAEFMPYDKGKPFHRVSIMPETGNVMIPNITPGEYQITLDKEKFKLSVSDEGEVAFKKAS